MNNKQFKTMNDITNTLFNAAHFLAELLDLPVGLQYNVEGTDIKGRKIHVMVEVSENDD